MKVMVLAPRYDIESADGGYSKHIHEFSATLAQIHDVDVTVLTLGDGNKTQSVDGYQFRMLRRQRWFKFVPWLPVLMLALEIRRARPDVIHLQGSAFDHFLVCAMLLTPRCSARCVTIHGHPAQEGVANGKFTRGSIRYALNAFGESALVRRFDAVICVTEHRRKEVIALSEPRYASKIHTIPNGIDESAILKLELPELQRLFALRWSKGGPRVLQVKSLLPYNGQDVLIMAFKSVLAVLPESRLTLVGEGWYRSILENIASRAGIRQSVDFLGKVENRRIPGLLGECSIAVMASRPVRGVEEGSSIALIEYMSSYAPVIASEVGGNSELVTDGVTGRLVPAGNADALAETIVELWRNPERSIEMARNAHECVLESRTWKNIVAKYIEVYRTSLGVCG